MTSLWRPGPLRGVLLCAGVLLALAACADEENVRVAQYDCDAAQADYGTDCGGQVFALEFQGQPVLLAMLPTELPPVVYKLSPGGASPAPAQDLYDGRVNTGLLDGNHPAAQVCQERTDLGHDDWYLPAIYELVALLTRPAVETGLTPGKSYWSSSEYDADPGQAWAAALLVPAATFTTLKDAAPPPHQVVCIRRPRVARF